ncbi:MAG TPA: bifunctional UDP-N-acetylglucosamine diphosphorylase/glucosamine-1-phosphate N-acetyltransferase GlmU [Thermodesulfobacteriota bacterium]|nr:bifunctional UDP-N-acetylglucosamine diphosphorylase/glucosamine-1-phosphate N-acetyltransferase GlmU [Thermodesulfobacteriota bacterium]
MSLAVVVLAAGMGKRMKSRLPKVLHPVLGRPMLAYVMDAVAGLSPEKTVIVIGNGGGEVAKAAGDGVSYARQEEQLGTGHAATCARSALRGFKGDVLILNGDYPLITDKTLKSFVKKHRKDEADVSVLTAFVDDPHGYGRILRNGSGNVDRIVEEKDASADEKKINEINSGTYCVKSDFLWKALSALTPQNSQGEYYLTDIVGIAKGKSLGISGIPVKDPNEVLGVNDRAQLAYAEGLLRDRTNGSLMAGGVTMVDPANTYISPGVKIGRDTVIYPGTYIYGRTVIGEGSFIGPGVWIEDSRIGGGVTIKMSCYITGADVEDCVSIGPFAHLRPGAKIMDGAKVGNFVEIKKSTVGRGSKVPHLSYVGDAVLGTGVNIGAGTITCNYDGFNKYETIIGDNVFIGSDTMLVAPVRVGKGATTGAGSTITKDVPEGALAIGRARQTIIDNWDRRPKEKKK